MPDTQVIHPLSITSAPRPESARRRRSRMSARSLLLMTALVLGGLVMLFPFYWTVQTAFSPNGSVLTTPSIVPRHLSLDGFRQLFSTSYDIPFLRVIMNSVVLAVVSTVLAVTTSAMAAYAFARLDFLGKGAVFAIYLATLMIPLQVLVVPLFIEMRTFHLVNTYEAVLAPNIASAFGVFLIRQAIAAVPKELDEAATIDGCGHLRIFTAIILPNIRPALATFAIFAFMASWNNLLWPLVILSSADHMTLPLALSSLHGQFSTQWNVVMAGSVLSIVPILAIYVFAQKYVVQSMATSGLK
ncbi:carbohydrate ABC transporter permease [Acidothermaceae bacterium B102]|nr:carbohydrate ABC transporter permease [Acidothermaceae bacterium B102]